MLRRILLVLFAVSLVGFVGCKGGNTDESVEKDQEGATAVASNGEGTEKDDEKPSTDAPSTGRYPNFPFGKLSADERAEFVEVAKAELCPCPGSTESLDACLQDKTKQCSIAVGAGVRAMQAIESGMNKTDTLAKVAEFVESMNKTYEFELENTPWKGAENPKVEVVEFADFECPFCMRASLAIDEVMKSYGDKGVRVYYKHYPLPMHKNAATAAHAAAAAHMQGKFWPMHDLIFKNQKSLSQAKLESFAQQIGLNFGKFKKDMNSAEAQARVAADRKEGEMAELTGTPTIFINGKRYMGAPDSTEELKRAFDEALAAADKGNAEPSN